MKNPLLRLLVLLPLLFLSGCVTRPAYQSETFQSRKDFKRVVLLDPHVVAGVRTDGSHVEWKADETAACRQKLVQLITDELRKKGLDVVPYTAKEETDFDDCRRIWLQCEAVADLLDKRWQKTNRGPVPQIVRIPFDLAGVQRITAGRQADGIVLVRFISVRDSAGYKAKRIGTSVLIGTLTLGFVVPIPFFDGSIVDLAFVDGKTGNIEWIDARNGPGDAFKQYLAPMLRMLPIFMEGN